MHVPLVGWHKSNSGWQLHRGPPFFERLHTLCRISARPKDLDGSGVENMVLFEAGQLRHLKLLKLQTTRTNFSCSRCVKAHDLKWLPCDIAEEYTID
jgi:hypothetical protein